MSASLCRNLLVSLALFCAIASSATIINVTPSNSTIGSFGYPNTATYGQTITAPIGDSTLTSFSFLMDLPATTTFRGYVYAWDGFKATGSALWTGAPTQSSGVGQELIDFYPGSGLALNPGSQYVIFASVTGLSGSGSGPWGSRNDGDVYPGGAFVFINNAQDASLWTTNNWTTNWSGPGSDLAFRASFVEGSGPAVPEPSTFALLTAGLGLIAVRRRR